ncbi:MAG: hypothetical protein OXC30_03360 [Alphaproteobacteria bacterium]|nr:hypothetical protein [Alphaproteobacteria bacterium]
MSLILLFLICFHAHGAGGLEQSSDHRLASALQVVDREEAWKKDKQDIEPYAANIISVLNEQNQLQKGVAMKDMSYDQLKSFAEPIIICLVNVRSQSALSINCLERFLNAFSALSQISSFLQTKPSSISKRRQEELLNCRTLSMCHLVSSVESFFYGMKDSHYSEYNIFFECFMKYCLPRLPEEGQIIFKKFRM